MKNTGIMWILLLIVIVVVIIILIFTIGSNNEENVNNTNIVIATPTTDENEEIYTEKLYDGTKLNTSEEFNSAKTYNNLSIDNIQYTEKDGMTLLLADVTNNGSTIHEMEWVDISILDENNEVITVMEALIGKIEPGATIKLNASTTADVSNAKDFTIEADK